MYKINDECAWCGKDLTEHPFVGKYGQFCDADCYWDHFYHYDGDADRCDAEAYHAELDELLGE
jgi:hypothetical protein